MTVAVEPSLPASKRLQGTADQVILTPSGGDLVLSLPQDIDTAATPQFAGATFTGSLAFSPNNTHDLTAVGARPRDIYWGRQALGPTGSAATPSIADASATTTGIYFGSSRVNFTLSGTNKVTVTSGFRLSSDSTINWTSSTSDAANGTIDLTLARDAANVFAQRNSTNAQEARWYNTYTNAANNEYFRVLWSSNRVFLTTVNTGSGTLRSMRFGTGSGSWDVDTSGHLMAVANNTYDIGALGATSPRTIYASTSFIAPASGVGYAFAGATTTGVEWDGSSLNFRTGNVIRLAASSSGIIIEQASGSFGAILVADAANVLALKNSTVAQTARIYGNGTKYLILSHNGTDAVIDTESTTGGLKLTAAATQKMGMWGATPVVQPAHIADPAGGAIIDAEARTAINAINALLASTGLSAAA